MLRKIRHLNIFVVFMLLLQLAVYPANALGSEKARITVEEAVQIVKANLTIPEKYSQLSSGFNEFNNRAAYSLNWNAPEQPAGSFSVEVDATNGDILNIFQWEEQMKPAFKLPVLSAEDAEKIATDLVSKLASKHLGEMQLVKDNQQVLTLDYSQPFTYNFQWIRLVNGIQFPGNGVNISISGEDGQLVSYNFNWTPDLVFPSAANVITPEKAREVFANTPMLELQYYIPPIMNPQTSETQHVILVYQLSNKYYGGGVDALSGEPVTLDTETGSNAVGDVTTPEQLFSTSSIAASSVSTSPSPIMESSTGTDSLENAQQISQSEAVEIVKKVIKIPKNLALRNASLNPDWQNPSEQVWDLYWRSEAMSSGDLSHLNASVNAKTGDIVGFNQSIGVSSDDKSKPVSRKEAQKIAEDLLKRLQPERFELVKADPETIYGGRIPPNIQFFNYVRVVNGIPVSRNGFNITVDTVAKQVTNYNMSWSDLEFPDTSNVLPLEQATERFLKMRPLALNYTTIFQQGKQEEVRLVYQPKMDYGSRYIPAMLDANTGDPMDWYGKSQSQWSGSQNYTDIQGNFAEKEIGIVGLTGAFGEYGATFRPDEKVTAGSLLRAILTAEGNNRDRVLGDEDVLKIAKERGWISEDIKLGSELTRVDLSKIMIRLIDMEPAAQVKGIYSVPFTDANTIQSDSLGYVALAWGFGILKIDNNTLQPNQTVTRAEAAYALVHAYSVERSRNSYLK